MRSFYTASTGNGDDSDDDSDSDACYRHKIASVISGSTQDAVDQCSVLLCKMLAIPSSASFMDYVTGSGSKMFLQKQNDDNMPEELTMKMEDKSFFKIGQYLIKLSSSVDLSIGVGEDFDDAGDGSFGRIPDETEERNLDVVMRGKFDALETIAFEERTKTFKARKEADSRYLPKQFVVLPVPHVKFYSDKISFEKAKRSFNRKFERMRSLDYYLLALKCSKIVVPFRNNAGSYSIGGDYDSFQFQHYDAEEIMYMNDPLMLTSTLEHRCGQICTSIYAFDLELLVGIRHEIWVTETELHNLNLNHGNRENREKREASGSFSSSLNVNIENEDGEEEEGFEVIGDPMSESDKQNVTEMLLSKLKRLKTAYAISFQREKNKLYNTISLECFVKRPWIFVFYLPYHCYQTVRGKKDNNGFDFHAMICEISVRMFETIELYDYFLSGMHGGRVYVTFLNCGFDILDDHINGIRTEEDRRNLTEIASKRNSFEVYQRKMQRFYVEAKRLLVDERIRRTASGKKVPLGRVSVEKLKQKIILINNDEISSFSKKLAYSFYTKDRLQKYPVLTKINIKEMSK